MLTFHPSFVFNTVNALPPRALRFGILAGSAEQILQRAGWLLRPRDAAPARELLLDIVAVKTPRRTCAGEAPPDLGADTGIIDRAAVVEFDPQHPLARVVADRAQLARVDALHFHDCLPDPIQEYQRVAYRIHSPSLPCSASKTDLPNHSTVEAHPMHASV